MSRPHLAALSRHASALPDVEADSSLLNVPTFGAFSPLPCGPTMGGATFSASSGLNNELEGVGMTRSRDRVRTGERDDEDETDDLTDLDANRRKPLSDGVWLASPPLD